MAVSSKSAFGSKGPSVSKSLWFEVPSVRKFHRTDRKCFRFIGLKEPSGSEDGCVKWTVGLVGRSVQKTQRYKRADGWKCLGVKGRSVWRAVFLKGRPFKDPLVPKDRRLEKVVSSKRPLVWKIHQFENAVNSKTLQVRKRGRLKKAVSSK